MSSTDRWTRFRILLVLCAVFIAYGAIFARAFYIQVIEGVELERKARNQHAKTIRIESKRGEIFDRNLEELAVSIEVDSVYAHSVDIDSPARVAEIAARTLSVSRVGVERKLRSPRRFEWIKRQVDLTDEQRDVLNNLDGVGTVKESRRYYPNGSLAANLMGFVGVDSKGLEGVELLYDRFLRGSSQRITGQKDAKGGVMLFEDIDRRVPLEGMDVILTIDRTIQYITEKALSRGVKGSGAKSGTAIVMDPFTGEVLAMAVYPTYDPNHIERFRPSHWRNRAITDLFEPGSTFKVFPLAAALEEGVVEPDDIFYCENGTYRVADRTFHDVKRFGWLSVARIIKYSSNIGIAKVGELVGQRRLYRYLRAFGFGTKTGIDLPGESRGLLPHYSRWSGVTINTVSFGHGVSVTGIQLVTALSAIANGGFLIKPYVVKSIRDPYGNVVIESNPVILRRVISEDTARKVTRILTGVTGPGGTGELAKIDGFEVAGKTGTAQKPDLEKGGYRRGAYIASFLGFVPAKAPRLAVLVAIDEPQEHFSGGMVAAPVFREIASQSLSYLGVFPVKGREPEKRFMKASVEMPYNNNEELDILPSVMPDFTGMSMRMVLRTAARRSLEVDIRGSGRAILQKPEPGRRIDGSSTVTVWFR